MKKSFYILLLISVLSGILIQAGCTASGSSDKPSYIIVGIDRTGSTGAMVAKYRDYSSRLFEYLRSETSDVKVAADIISDRPLTKSDFKVKKDIPPQASSELDWQYQDRIDTTYSDLSSGFEELLTRPVDFKGTHILDFISLAASELPKDRAENRQIWLLTDGFEEDDQVNFESEGSQLTGERIQQVLDAAKASGQLPDLTGVELFIVGAGGGDYENESTLIYDNVKNFWVAYAKATNATLCQYGPALVDFNSCQY